jgi:hypothetical protein
MTTTLLISKVCIAIIALLAKQSQCFTNTASLSSRSSSAFCRRQTTGGIITCLHQLHVSPHASYETNDDESINKDCNSPDLSILLKKAKSFAATSVLTMASLLLLNPLHLPNTLVVEPAMAAESRIVGQLQGSGLVFKDTLQIESFEDPKVKAR